MEKNFKIIVFGGIGVFLCLIALIIVLMVKNSQATGQEDVLQEKEMMLDSLNNVLELRNLTDQFNQLNADINRYEGSEITLANDSLLIQINESRERINSLMNELDREKKTNRNYAAKIKKLEAEIGTLKEIARHYLEEIKRLNEENQGLRQDNERLRQDNTDISSKYETVSKNNEELSQTVKLAKKLNITGLTLSAYNKKDKPEKNVTKAKKLGVSFTVSPNNTAAPGMKTFYVRITSPEGALLGGGSTFPFDGTMLAATASRKMEYANQELPVSIYWDSNTTLTKGEYTVEVFCDEYRLASTRFNMK